MQRGTFLNNLRLCVYAEPVQDGDFVKANGTSFVLSDGKPFYFQVENSMSVVHTLFHAACRCKQTAGTARTGSVDAIF